MLRKKIRGVRILKPMAEGSKKLGVMHPKGKEIGHMNVVIY